MRYLVAVKLSISLLQTEHLQIAAMDEPKELFHEFYKLGPVSNGINSWSVGQTMQLWPNYKKAIYYFHSSKKTTTAFCGLTLLIGAI
jgi:hypothetical protein